MTVLRATLLGLVLGALTLYGAFAMAAWGQTPAGAAPLTGGAPAAGAAGQSGTPETNPYAATFVNALATHLGVTGAQVNSAATGAAMEVLAQAVKDGKITATQAAQIKTSMQQIGFPGLAFPKMVGGSGMVLPAGNDREAALLQPAEAAAAKLFGMSVDDLLAQGKAGKSLADLAQAHNVALATVKSTILTSAKATLDAGVAAGKWTQRQADETYSGLTGKIDSVVTQPIMASTQREHVVVAIGSAPLPSDPAKGGSLPVPPNKILVRPGIELASYGPAFVHAFITRLGVTEARLNSAFTAATSATLAQVVKDGKLTQAQATDFQNMAQKMGFAAFAFPGAAGGPLGMVRQGIVSDSATAQSGGMQAREEALIQPVAAAVAPLFGLTGESLVGQLQSGATLTSLAQAHGVAVQKVQDTILSAAKTTLDAAVQSGKWTRGQADETYRDLVNRIDSIMTQPLQ